MDKFYSNIEYFQENMLGNKDFKEQVTVDSAQPDAQPVIASAPDQQKLCWKWRVPVGCALLKTPQSS